MTVKDKDEKKTGCVATNLSEESAPPVTSLGADYRTMGLRKTEPAFVVKNWLHISTPGRAMLGNGLIIQHLQIRC